MLMDRLLVKSVHHDTGLPTDQKQSMKMKKKNTDIEDIIGRTRSRITQIVHYSKVLVKNDENMAMMLTRRLKKRVVQKLSMG